jgi:predicted PurR-regulated permease PerM
MDLAPVKTQPPERNSLNRAVLLAAGLLVLGLLFQELTTLLVAVLITVLIAIPLSASADLGERYHVPRAIGALAGLLFGFGLIAAIFALVIPPAVDEADQFIDELDDTIANAGEDLEHLTGEDSQEIGRGVQEFINGFTEEPERLLGPLASAGATVASIIAALIFILITAYFMAVRPEPLLNGIKDLVPPARRPRAEAIIARVRTSWVGWMQGLVADMVISGVLLYIGLTIIDLDFALVFAVLGAFLVIIPYFGSFIGGVFPVLVGLADSPEKALLTLAVYLIVQQVEGNLIIPLIMSQRVRLHPALIAVGVLIVGQLLGIIGLFVAVPVIAGIVILVDELYVKRHSNELETAAPNAPPASETILRV